MKRIRFSTAVQAPRVKVWNTMLEDQTYRQWTSPFNRAGSFFEGDWKQGSTMRFFGPDEEGNLGGMISRIEVNRPHEHLSIRHIGMLRDGQEDTTSEEARRWASAFENYTFREQGEATEVIVELDSPEDFVSYFEETWPEALQKLKELAEA